MSTAVTGPARPITAGIVTALVGFTSAFVVVLAGLRAVGATDAQAASGLLAVTVTMGVACIVLSLRTRMPLMSAWSTPGAALLAATGAVDGGWPAAVGAFLLTGALIVLTGLWPMLGRLVAGIPTTLAQAMLAGVLLPLCVAPFTGLAENPWGVVPVLLTWLVFARFSPRWAVPAAFVAATVVIAVSLAMTGTALDASRLVPTVEFTAPTLTVGSVVGIALPLWIVTMASQNVPGVAIMRSYGYAVPWRLSMVTTGVGTMAAAAAGGHAINLAAISAALGASEEADPDPKRRWIAGVTCGIGYLVLAAACGVFVTLVLLAPAAVIPAVAGVALFASFGSAVQQAVNDVDERMPAVVTFLVAASGIALFGVSAAFWALAAGLIVRAVLRVGRSA